MKRVIHECACAAVRVAKSRPVKRGGCSKEFQFEKIVNSSGRRKCGPGALKFNSRILFLSNAILKNASWLSPVKALQVREVGFQGVSRFFKVKK